MTFKEWVESRAPGVVFDIQSASRDQHSIKHVAEGVWEFRGKEWTFPANAVEEELALYFAYRRWCRNNDEEPSEYKRLGRVLTAADVVDKDPNGLDAFFGKG